MKKLTLAILIMVAASLAMAQGPGGRPGGPGGGRMDPKARLAQLTKELNLTPAQVTKVTALQTKMQAEMKKLRDAPGDPKSKGPQMMKVFTGYGESMKKILTKDQVAKFDAMQKKRMDRMKSMGGPGGKGGPGAPAKTGGR